MRPNRITSRTVVRVCEHCGNEFAVFASAVRWHPVKFCSPACHYAHHPSLAERFWSKVNKAGECWLWTAKRDRSGYGRFQTDKSRSDIAPRVAWRLTCGEVLDGLFVLHRCDNPPCVRPDHLFLGTFEENMADMVAKGRSPRGERNVAAKLTDAQVIEMRRLFDAGLATVPQLSAASGVGYNSVRRAVTRKGWLHLP